MQHQQRQRQKIKTPAKKANDKMKFLMREREGEEKKRAGQQTKPMTKNLKSDNFKHTELSTL